MVMFNTWFSDSRVILPGARIFLKDKAPPLLATIMLIFEFPTSFGIKISDKISFDWMLSKDDDP